MGIQQTLVAPCFEAKARYPFAAKSPCMQTIFSSMTASRPSPCSLASKTAELSHAKKEATTVWGSVLNQLAAHMLNCSRNVHHGEVTKSLVSKRDSLPRYTRLRGANRHAVENVAELLPELDVVAPLAFLGAMSGSSKDILNIAIKETHHMFTFREPACAQAVAWLAACQTACPGVGSQGFLPRLPTKKSFCPITQRKHPVAQTRPTSISQRHQLGGGGGWVGVPKT